MEKFEYRKSKIGTEETYCCINTDIYHGPPSKGFTLHLVEIPFLATSTRKDFSYASIFPRFSPADFGPILLCQDGWENISEKEYNQVFAEVLDSMK